MARIPPVFVSPDAETAWYPQTTGTKSTPAQDVAAGSVLVGMGAGEDGSTVTALALSGLGLTWTTRQSNIQAGSCTGYLWTATDAVGHTAAQATLTPTLVGAKAYGANLLRFTGSDGIGASQKATVATGAPTLNIDTTQDNSALVVLCIDWNASAKAGRAWRAVNGITPDTTNGFEVTADDSSAGAAYTVFGAYYPDAGPAGTKTVGMTAPSQKYTLMVVEVLGTAVASANTGYGDGSYGTGSYGVRSGGGAALTQNIDDGIAATDSVSTAVGIARTVADPAALTDATALARAAVLADAAGLTDSALISEGYQLAISDAAGLTDAVAAGLAFAVAVNDSAGLTDATSFARALLVADPATLTDVLSSTAAFIRQIDDPAALTDLAIAAAGWVEQIDDLAGLTDSQAPVQGRTLILADSAGLTDGVALAEAIDRQIGDTASITDATSFQRVEAIDDVAGLTDALSFTSAFIRTIADAMAIADAQQIDSTGAKSKSLADVATITDSLATTSDIQRTLSDTIAATDTLSRGFVVAVAEVLAATDQTTVAASVLQALADAASITDQATPQVTGQNLTKSIADGLGITDATIRSRGYGALIDELIAAADQISSIHGVVEAISDALAIEDGVEVNPGLVLLVDDVLVVTDAVSAQLLVGGPLRYLAVRLSDAALTTIRLDARALAEAIIAAKRVGVVRLEDSSITEVDVSATRLDSIHLSEEP